MHVFPNLPNLTVRIKINPYFVMKDKNNVKINCQASSPHCTTCRLFIGTPHPDCYAVHHTVTVAATLPVLSILADLHQVIVAVPAYSGAIETALSGQRWASTSCFVAR
jgi:hypothetical protein